MNHPPDHRRDHPAVDRPAASFVASLLLLASVPVALWAVANPIAAASLAVVLVGARTLALAVASRLQSESVNPRASDRTNRGAPARR